MARIVETTEVSFLIENIITSAPSYVVIVNPFFQVPDRMRLTIERRLNEKQFTLYILTRSKEVEKLTWLTCQKKVEIKIVPNLHAKYYLNSVQALLTSMNFYEYSMVNNVEVGIHMTQDDFELRRNLYDHFLKFARYKNSGQFFISNNMKTWTQAEMDAFESSI